MNLIIIQARTNSKRFPNKVLNDVFGKKLIQYALDCAEASNFPYIVAIPKGDKKLIEFLKENKINYFEGSEDDVLERFYNCAVKYGAQNIIRLCADTLYYKHEIKDFWKIYHKTNRFTYGNGIFICSFDDLEKAFNNATGEDREHVTTYLYRCINYREDIKKLNPFAMQ